MSDFQWQDLLGGTVGKEASDDESTPLNFSQMAELAEKEAAYDDASFYHELFTPAKTSTFDAFLHPKAAAKKKTAAGAGTAPAFEIGDDVRGKMPNGSLFNGTVESVENGKVKLKNERGIAREFPLESIETSEAIEQKKHQQQDQFDNEQSELRTRAQREMAAMVNVDNPEGSYEALASHLQRVGYSLRLDTTPDSLPAREAEYAEWTGGEELNDDCTKVREKSQDVGGWILKFPFSDEVKSMIPFPMHYRGTVGRPSTTPQALSDGRTVNLDYTAAVAELVKRGVRMNCQSTTQELHASSKFASVKYAALPMPKQGTPEWHQLKIAIKSLQMNPAMLGVMGGPNAEQSHEILAKYGLVWDEAKNRPVKGTKHTADMDSWLKSKPLSSHNEWLKQQEQQKEKASSLKVAAGHMFQHDAEIVVSQVLNGGFSQLWYNYSEREGYHVKSMIMRTAKFFEDAGAPEIANIFRAASQIDGEILNERDVDEQEEDELEEAWDPIEKQFYHMWDSNYDRKSEHGDWEKYFSNEPKDSPIFRAIKK